MLQPDRAAAARSIDYKNEFGSIKKSTGETPCPTP
jgi:hypothetical protein